MEDVIKIAMETVKAQAGVRPMTSEEVLKMANEIAYGLNTMSANMKAQQLAIQQAIMQQSSMPAAFLQQPVLQIPGQPQEMPAIDMEDVPAKRMEDARRSIKKNYVICLECGEKFKLISSRHLAIHGLTPEQYCEKWGLKKGTPLSCKDLVNSRRERMQSMKIWERRKDRKGASQAGEGEETPVGVPSQTPTE